jgi:putative transposase
LHYHVVFSSKKRQPIIAAKWRPRLFRYFAGMAVNLKGKCVVSGGTDDHVHLLVELNAMHRLADFVREIKRGSSIWIHGDIGDRRFEWQEGYAGITVSPSAINAVRRYIENQEEHHRERSFIEELKIILKKAGIEYDERYLD